MSDYKGEILWPAHAVPYDAYRKMCTEQLGVSPQRVGADLQRWMEEDHGAGDVSVWAGGIAERGRYYIVAKQDFILCGLPMMAQVFRELGGQDISIGSDHKDGDAIKKGEVVLAGEGPFAAVLMAERVALNLGARLSGISTKTRQMVQMLQQHGAGKAPTLLETRKTTPGLRLYEKYATRVGGARNHRHGLDSGAMLKENHLKAGGGILPLMQSLQTRLPVLCATEVEVSTVAEFQEAARLGAQLVMLDNFTQADIQKAVAIRNTQHPKVRLEVSGNLDEQSVPWVATSGVDFVSMGALIHKAVWIDMSLQIVAKSGGPQT